MFCKGNPYGGHISEIAMVIPNLCSRNPIFKNCITNCSEKWTPHKWIFWQELKYLPTIFKVWFTH